MLVSLYNQVQNISLFVITKLSVLGDAWSLVLISTILGIILVLIYGKISFQKKVAQTKRGIAGNIIESVLFKHDIKVALKAQTKALVGALKYAGLAIPPLIILAIPVIFILGQLFPAYAVRALKNGETAIITAKLNENSIDQINNIQLEAKGLEEVLPPVRINSTGEISWRVKANLENGVIKLNSNVATLEIQLNQNNIWRGAGYESLSMAWLTGSTALNSEQSKVFSSISVIYPDNSIKFLGISWNWLVLFFVVSLIAGLVSAKLAKIEV